MIEESQASQADDEGSIPFTRSNAYKALALRDNIQFTRSLRAPERRANVQTEFCGTMPALSALGDGVFFNDVKP